MLRLPMPTIPDDGLVARVVGRVGSLLIDVLLLPVVVWDEIQMALDDDPYETEDL